MIWSTESDLVSVNDSGLATVSDNAVGGEVIEITARANNGAEGHAKLTINTPG